jgi:predicted Zn-dependent peptidase
MLFKGTRRRSARQISQDVEGIGGYLNAFTSEELTCVYSKARHDACEELLDVILDMFLNSEFDPSEIEKERTVIKEELAMYLDQPHHHVQELLNETLWPDQPLGRSLTGTEQTLDSMRRAQLVGYQRSNYVAPATLIVAAGRVRHSTLVKWVAGYGRKLRSGSCPRFAPARSAQTAPRVRLCSKQAEQTQVALGIRACSRHDERRYALRVLNTILGENMSSRLFQVIREDHGLAYSIHSTPSHFEDVGDLVISAGLDTKRLRQVLRLIVKELRRLIDQAPSRREIQRAREYLIGQIDLSLENTESQMMWLGEQILGYGKITRPTEIKRRIAQVTAKEVQAAARDFFRSERMNLALVSPLKNAHGLVKALDVSAGAA